MPGLSLRGQLRTSHCINRKRTVFVFKEGRCVEAEAVFTPHIFMLVLAIGIKYT